MTETNWLHMIYFRRMGVRIGAAQYKTYLTGDGKCFLLDFWAFPECRGNVTGHDCFDALVSYNRADGAAYCALNCANEKAVRFRKSLVLLKKAPINLMKNCLCADNYRFFMAEASRRAGRRRRSGFIRTGRSGFRAVPDRRAAPAGSATAPIAASIRRIIHDARRNGLLPNRR